MPNVTAAAEIAKGVSRPGLITRLGRMGRTATTTITITRLRTNTPIPICTRARSDRGNGRPPYCIASPIPANALR